MYIKPMIFLVRKMLMNVFRTLVNNSFLKNFDIIFIGNKNFVKALIAFFFLF